MSDQDKESFVKQEDVENFFQCQLSKIIRTFQDHKRNWYNGGRDYWPTFYLKMNRPPKPKVIKTVKEVTNYKIQGKAGDLDVVKPINPIILYNPFEVLEVETQTEHEETVAEVEEAIRKLRSQIDEYNLKVLMTKKVETKDVDCNTDSTLNKRSKKVKDGHQKKPKEPEVKEVIKEVIIPVIKEENKQDFVREVIQLGGIATEVSKKLTRDNFQVLETITPIIEKFKSYTNSKSYLMTLDILLRLIRPLIDYVHTTLKIDKLLAESPDLLRHNRQAR
jgi:hypothetical protein